MHTIARCRKIGGSKKQEAEPRKFDIVLPEEMDRILRHLGDTLKFRELMDCASPRIDIND